MTFEDQRDLGLVFRALHFTATRTATGRAEQRGDNYGPPEWHEGVELWKRALAVEKAADFAPAWSRLVAQAKTYLAVVQPSRAGRVSDPPGVAPPPRRA
jgi:hypothetical protein